jgi:L-fuconolactonase
MRLDAHQHFWRYLPARDTWITDEMSVLKKDFLPGQLAPELLANQFQGSIAVQADQSEAETFFLLDLASNTESIRGVVGWADLCAPNVSERLEVFSHDPKLCGFRHIVQAEPDDFMLQPDFLRGVACLEEFGFVYDILIYASQLPAAIALTSRFPEQAFVVDHLAKPTIRTRDYRSWAEHMRAIAANRNVYCKLSGLVTESDWNRWTGDDFKPYLEVVFEAFGVDRLMFGSDWPVCLLAASYSQVVGIVSDYIRDLPPIDRDKIFGLNAAHFYCQRASRRAIAT